MKGLFNIIAKVCKEKLGIQVAYIRRIKGLMGLTAVHSSKGFWYTGNVFESSDIAHGIAVNGIVEKEDTELVEKIMLFLLGKNMTPHFYDIGANTGYYGIFATYLGKGKIDCVSFEPLKEHADCIRESAFLNRIESKMKIYEMGIGSREEMKKIRIDGSGSSFTENFLPGKNYPTDMVKVVNLDDIIKRDSLPEPTFIKIDIEGHEYEAMQGAARTIAQAKPVFFIEIIKKLNTFTNPNYEAIFDLMKKAGYECYTFDAGKITLFSLPSKEQGDHGPKMFLFLHPAKHADLIRHLS